MPIIDKPFHFVKWCNPTEVVKVNLEDKNSEVVTLTNRCYDLNWDLRGGTQVVRWDEDTYMAIVHECYFRPQDANGYKDSIYRHRFILWDTEFNIKLLTQPFDFMCGKVEFCTGLEIVGGDVYILFGFQDSSCYAIKTIRQNIHDLIWRALKPALKST